MNTVNHFTKHIISSITVCFFLLSGVTVHAQYPETLIRKGNSEYKAGKYQEAEKNYRKAQQKDSNNYKALFNLGDALYKQKNYSQASTIYNNLLNKNIGNNIKQKVYHNLGNSLLNTAIHSDTMDFASRQGKIKESIEAYKNAMRLAPNDNDTRYNLVFANKLLKKMQNQQQQQQKQNQQQQKQQQQKQQQQKQNENNKNEKQQKKEPNISKEDAERMLEALKNNEKKTREKLEKGQQKPAQTNIENDW